MDANQAISSAGSTLTKGITHLSVVSPLEAALTLALFAAGWVLGNLLNRLIDRLPHHSWKTRLVDYLAPLLAPLITLLLLSFAIPLLASTGDSLSLLPLAQKVAVAWLAVRLVMLMSTRRSAGWVIALGIIPFTLLHLFGLWEPLKKALKSVEFHIGKVELTLYGVLHSALAIAILIWLAGFISKQTEKQLRKARSLHPGSRALIMKILQIALYFFTFLIGLQVLGISLTALSVFGGALGVGLGFGLQKIASNFISGIILLFERSVQVSDLVELENGTLGFVRHTAARYTLLETVEGKDVLIPNEEFITQRMTNWTYSSHKARVEISVSVGYESDLPKVQQLMVDAARAHPRCIADPPPSCFLHAFGDSGVEMLLHFWIGDVTEGRAGPRSDVMLTIFQAFRTHHISIPYPHREVHVFNETDIPVEKLL